jgi:hypothetical protein
MPPSPSLPIISKWAIRLPIILPLAYINYKSAHRKLEGAPRLGGEYRRGVCGRQLGFWWSRKRGQSNVTGLPTETAHRVHSRVHCPLNIAFDPLPVGNPRQAQSQLLDRSKRRRLTRQYPVQQRGIAGRPGHWPDVVQGPCERRCARRRDAPIRGLVAGDAAECRRQSNLPAGIGTERRQAHPARYCNCRSARTTARRALWIPRIVTGTEHAGFRREVVGKLVHICFADQHAAGRLEPLDDCRVVVGTRSRHCAEAAVVRTPAVSKRSFTTIGIPWSGCSPTDDGRNDLARARDCSLMIVITAFRRGLSLSTRLRHAWVNSVR